MLRVASDRAEERVVELRVELRTTHRQRLTTERGVRRVRRIPIGKLPHDAQLRRVSVGHGGSTCLAIHIDDIDDRPVREIADGRVHELLQRHVLIRRDEQLGAKPREQPLARFGALLIGDVENRPDELRRTSSLAFLGEVHPRKREDPTLPAIGVLDAIFALKAPVAARVGRAHQTGVESLPVVGMDPRFDDARA